MTSLFRWDARRFETVGDFREYLNTLARPTWVKRIIMHHTWKPVQADWRGFVSMASLRNYYENEVIWYDKNGMAHKGWPAGPHLFICKGSPKPEQWDGIYQGTPITEVGVHAGECNDGIGIEDVGNFDLAPWGSDLYAFNLGIVHSLLEWTSLPVTAVFGHRDCNSPKTCPGSKVDLAQFRTDLGKAPSDPWAEFGSCPPPQDQRSWDYNQRWLEHKAQLGKSQGCPQYIPTGKGTAIRVFQGGIVVDDNYHRGKAWTWDELLKGS